MPKVTINGADINYTWDGIEHHPVLILSNSLTTNLHLWDGQISAFTEQFRVLRYDNRGHGESSSPLGDYSLDDIAGDAIGLMDHFQIPKANLCGISMGGMVGMWMGINAADRINKLVLCNTSSDVQPPGPWQDRIDTVKEGGMSAIADVVLERFLSEEARARSPNKVELVGSMLSSCDVLGYAGCCAAIRDMSLTSQLDQINNPTLIVAGELDPATPVSHSELVVEHIVGAELIIIPGVAHLSNLEKPEEFNRVVLEFLSE